MTIIRIETMVVGVPLRVKGASPLMSGKPRTSTETLFVRIGTDAGITRRGEAFGPEKLRIA